MTNVPTGTYKNHVGAELEVAGPATRATTNFGILAGDIAVALAPGGAGEYLVTAASLAEAGYKLLPPTRTIGSEIDSGSQPGQLLSNMLGIAPRNA